MPPDATSSNTCIETDTFRVEPARPEQSPVLLDLIIELATFEKLQDQVVADAAGIQACLEQDLIEAYLCYEGHQLAGYAITYYSFSTFEGRRGLYLEDIYIRPAFRSKGYGKRFLSYLAQRALDTGCPRFEWACLDWNTAAQQFYTSLGAVARPEWITFRTEGDALRRLAQPTHSDIASGPSPRHTQP